MFQLDQESPDFLKGKQSIMNLKIHFNVFLFPMRKVAGNTVFAMETVFCQNLSQIKKYCTSSEYSKGVLLTSS
uniref:Putative ovule protein n=1 Tax=Solanum chacoense TaxID=4108 RepID=A0A0V0H5L8_SOLCH